MHLTAPYTSNYPVRIMIENIRGLSANAVVTQCIYRLLFVMAQRSHPPPPPPKS